MHLIDKVQYIQHLHNRTVFSLNTIVNSKATKQSTLKPVRSQIFKHISHHTHDESCFFTSGHRIACTVYPIHTCLHNTPSPNALASCREDIPAAHTMPSLQSFSTYHTIDSSGRKNTVLWS